MGGKAGVMLWLQHSQPSTASQHAKLGFHA